MDGGRRVDSPARRELPQLAAGLGVQCHEPMAVGDGHIGGAVSDHGTGDSVADPELPLLVRERVDRLIDLCRPAELQPRGNLVRRAAAAERVVTIDGPLRVCRSRESIDLSVERRAFLEAYIVFCCYLRHARPHADEAP